MSEDERNAILDWTEAHKQNLTELARSLIALPSENKPPHGSERACQLFVADVMRDLGCRVDVFTPLEVPGLTAHPQYWPGREYTDRPNVVGVLPGLPSAPGGSARRKSLLFTGHADVVPAIGQGKHGWWDGAIDGGRLYGRGANDMKGGIAAYLTAARCVRELGLELHGDLLLETVVDEEFGGANGTLACRQRGYNADAAICPEPNNLLISASHRGGQQFRLHMSAAGAGMAFGEAVLPDPVTALGHALVALDRYNDDRQPRLRRPGFQDSTFPLMPFAMRAGEMLPWGTGEAIPETAWVEFWIEIPPGVTQVELQSELKAAVAGAAGAAPALQRVAIRWEERTRFLAGSGISGDHPILAVLASNLKTATGREPSFGPAPFTCDGFIFNLHSPTPVVIFGPRGGNAHAPDEWVEIEDLIALAKTYALTIAGWLA